MNHPAARPPGAEPFDALLFDVLLFDMDGTLLSSLDSVVRCWNRWAREQGVAPADFARVELHGRPAAEIVADLVPAERAPAALARIEELETEDVGGGGVALLPGTEALLRTLPERRWAVVTSATRALAEARLRQTGIEPPLLVAADDITRGKPDPEPFLLAARKLGADPARCVVFEDAPAGLQAARAAGMRSVALATTHPREELRADLVADDLAGVTAQVTPGGVRLAGAA